MILVTGGTGFLGAYIIRELRRQGLPVRALRRTAKQPFFIDPSVWQGVEWVDGDVLDIGSLEDAMQGVTGVVHAAAVVSFHGADRARMLQVNIEGTANVVNVALENGMPRLLHVSSVAALGRTRAGGVVNEDKKWSESKSNTQYAVSKHRAEIEVWRGFAEGLEGVVINPSTILGFGDWHQSSCAIFRNVYKGMPWYTEGINGFVGVEDVARATVQLLQSGITERRFIVNGENWTFHRLLDTIATGFGTRKPWRHASPVLGELAWRIEGIKSLFSGGKPLLTKESARVAHSRTEFDSSALLEALPGFSYTPLDELIPVACKLYQRALGEGLLKV
ncbi:NAD-dependent epimerase/dehydratase family protein [Flaviaesturariibacter amylovorans]|uniref:NAD-dependent epimerase/dehydratase family protein n=1 Tax=Flaviaesturariibacter amylovorans TaxID=1084520 RepID=A0ABP8HVT2_9BACT